jgi:plastocyanin
MVLRSLRLGWVQLTPAAVFLLSVGVTGVAAAADGSAIPAATKHVSATDQLQFSPPTLRIHVVDTVVWKNTGTAGCPGRLP